MNTVYLGIGSNIYSRTLYIYQAFNDIEMNIGKIDKISSIHRTKPWNMPENTPFFYNACILVKTLLSAEAILEITQKIEQKLGRTKKSEPKNVYESRTIDIDILLFNDEIIYQNNLVVPHPYLHQRMFVLLPLSEIAGDIYHPTLKVKIKDLISCKSTFV